jgi:nucleoside-diphosphate-sugar epimerase
MKKILVTGPDGFVGTEVCGALTKRNHRVCGAQWEAGALPEGCESVVVGDINGDTNWENALKDIDTVVHLAARVHVMNDTSDDPLSAFREVNVEGTRHLAEKAAAAGVQHFVFISSIKVNGESTTGKAFSEKDIPKPEDPYAVSKWEAEQVLRDIEAKTDMSVTVLRPPLVYGPGVKANFKKMIQFVERGIPLPLGSIDNKRSLLGLGNFADVICLCVENKAARGETFLLSDGRDISTEDLVRKISVAWNKKPRVFSLNHGLLGVLGRVTGKQAMIKRLTESLLIDSSKVRRALDWTPPYSMEAELARTAFASLRKCEV